MSLYFKERVEEEQNEDPENDNMIKFCIPWIFSIPPAPGTFIIPELIYSRLFRTTYDIYSAEWEFVLTKFKNFKVKSLNPIPIQESTGSCYFSYELFSDTEMRSKIRSSKRIALTPTPDAFVTPDGAMAEFIVAYGVEKIAKVIIFVELELPELNFTIPSDLISHKWCEEYPEDMDLDFRFEFLKDGDFIIKCPDGSVPALKMVLNLRPSILKTYLNETKSDELVVEHKVDVVKPIIMYMHSQCFEMPKSYDLDYADRLLKAFKFFQLKDEGVVQIGITVELSFYDKFIKESHDFEIILQWASFASRNSLTFFVEMILVIIARKHYYKWLQRFPGNTRNAENQLFRDNYRNITSIFASTLRIQAILDLNPCK